MVNPKTKANYSLERLKRLHTKMREQKLDVVLTLNAAHIRWLSSWSEVFDEEPAHLAFISARKSHLHTDSRYVEAMRAKDKEGTWQISAEPIDHFAYARKLLAKSRKPMMRLGYEASLRLDLFKRLKKTLTAAGGPKVKLVETQGLFEKLRAIKDADELRILRKAQSITDAAFLDMLPLIKPGISELELANHLEFALRNRGAQGVAFPSIVASGPHSAFPHARPTKRRLKRGDLLVMDFGARYLDYSADMTRTVVVGKATEKQRTIYEAVLAALLKAKGGIKAGVTGNEAFELAQSSLKQKELDKAFTHALGHGVGIDVHEQPLLSHKNTEPLLAGNVVTVEPGVYLPGFGGVRIEDFGQVTETGFASFTRSEHALIELC